MTFRLRYSGTTATTAVTPRRPLSPLPVNSDRSVSQRLTTTLETPLLSTVLQQHQQPTYQSLLIQGQLSLTSPPRVDAMSTSESWDANRHTARCISLVSVVLQCKLISDWRLRKRRSAPPCGLYGSGRTLSLLFVYWYSLRLSTEGCAGWASLQAIWLYRQWSTEHTAAAICDANASESSGYSKWWWRCLQWLRSINVVAGHGSGRYMGRVGSAGKNF